MPLREGRAQAEETWKPKGTQRDSIFPNLPKHQKISFYSLSIDPPGRDLAVLIKKLAQMAAQDKRYKL